MTTNAEPTKPSTVGDSLPHFGLTIPVRYYIPESHLESEELDEETMQRVLKLYHLLYKKCSERRKSSIASFKPNLGWWQ